MTTIQFLGTGSFFLFSIGVAKYLREHYRFVPERVVASSGGCLAAVAYLTLRIDEFDEVAGRLAQLFGQLHGRMLSLFHVRRVYRQALQLLVTPDRLPLLRGRLQVTVTTLPFFHRKLYSGPFVTAEEVIEDLMASAYIPSYFFLPPAGHWLEVDGGAALDPIDTARSLVISAKCKPYSDIYISQSKISSLHFWSQDQLLDLYALGYQRADQRQHIITQKLMGN